MEKNVFILRKRAEMKIDKEKIRKELKRQSDELCLTILHCLNKKKEFLRSVLEGKGDSTLRRGNQKLSHRGDT